MQYDVIVLGATFTAAGLLQEYGDKCLVLERRPQAGYEFLNAIKFGAGYNKPLQTEQAKALYEAFCAKKAFYGERVMLFDCAGPFYRLLEGKNVMLNMEIVSVDAKDGGFEVTAHGVSGYRTYTANKVIDTRVHDEMIEKKSLNILVYSETKAPFTAPEGTSTEQWGYADDILLKCPVPVNANYIEARKAAMAVVEKLPADYKLLLVPDMFDCTLCGTYPTEKDGIVYLPSLAYENPLLAFDAGVLYAKGGVL